MSSTKGITTVDDAFAWFEKNIARVDDQDNQDAKEVWPDIVKAVEKKLPVERHFLSGSYGRKVQAIKLKDIDIIVEVHDVDGAYRASAKDTLLEVQHALRDCELVRQARPPSVRAAKALLHDYEFHVDVVPAIDDGGNGCCCPATWNTTTSTSGPGSTPSSSATPARTRTMRPTGCTALPRASSAPTTSATRRRRSCGPTTRSRCCTTPSATPRRCRRPSSRSSTTPTTRSPRAG